MPEDHKLLLDQEHKLHGTDSYGYNVAGRERQALKSAQNIIRRHAFEQTLAEAHTCRTIIILREDFTKVNIHHLYYSSIVYT